MGQLSGRRKATAARRRRPTPSPISHLPSPISHLPSPRRAPRVLGALATQLTFLEWIISQSYISCSCKLSVSLISTAPNLGGVSHRAGHMAVHRAGHRVSHGVCVGDLISTAPNLGFGHTSHEKHQPYMTHPCPPPTVLHTVSHTASPVGITGAGPGVQGGGG